MDYYLWARRDFSIVYFTGSINSRFIKKKKKTAEFRVLPQLCFQLDRVILAYHVYHAKMTFFLTNIYFEIIMQYNVTSANSLNSYERHVILSS